MKYWKLMVKKDYQLNKSLKVDKKLCRIILSNKTVFKEMTVSSAPIRDYGMFIRAEVSGFKTGYDHLRRDGKWKTYATKFCFGSNHIGTFTNKVKKMTHLSQFLMFYSAWLAKKNN